MPPIGPTIKSCGRRTGPIAAKQPSPRQCVEWLASNLHGVLIRGATWLACTRQLAYFLERARPNPRGPPPGAVFSRAEWRPQTPATFLSSFASPPKRPSTSRTRSDV